MTWIFKTLRRCCEFAMAPLNGKPHVSFSPSTLNIERERTMRHIASPIPFQNFLNEMRLTALDERGKDHMTLRESSLLRKSAIRLWSTLNEGQKDKYRELANNAPNTRVPIHIVSESKSRPQLTLNKVAQRSHSEPMVNWGLSPKNARKRKTNSSEEQVGKDSRKRQPKERQGTKKSAKQSKLRKLDKPKYKTFKKTLSRCNSLSLPTEEEFNIPVDLDTSPQTSKTQLHLSRKRPHSNTNLDNSDSSNDQITAGQTEQSQPELPQVVEVEPEPEESYAPAPETKRRRWSNHADH